MSPTITRTSASSFGYVAPTTSSAVAVRVPFFRDRARDVLVQRAPADVEILQIACAGVRCAAQHDDAFVGARRETAAANRGRGTDSRSPRRRRSGRTLRAHSARRCCRCRRASHQGSPARPDAPNGCARSAVRARSSARVRGEVGDLRLEAADEIGRRVDDRAAEVEDRVGSFAQRAGKFAGSGSRPTQTSESLRCQASLRVSMKVMAGLLFLLARAGEGAGGG